MKKMTKQEMMKVEGGVLTFIEGLNAGLASVGCMTLTLSSVGLGLVRASFYLD